MGVIQIKRHIAGAVAIPALAAGELAYLDPQVATNDDSLSVGSTVAGVATTRTLVSNQRQVELAGAQTITGVKTFDISNIKITGGAAGDGITTDGQGNLSFSAAASGGLTAVATDSSLTGNGTSTSPLSVATVDGGTF